MPNWKKVITSGSDAALNSLLVTTSLTASGLIYPSIDGTTGQVVTTDGAGNLSFLNVENTTISIKNVSGVTIQKGTPCYITGSGTSGNLAGVFPADASNPLRMPAGVIAGETLTAGSEGIGLINGFIANVATSVFNAGDSIYVAAGGGYTNVRPTGSSILVQKLGNIEKSHPSNGSGVINGPGYYNDLPNVQSGYTWVGNSNGVAVAIATSSIQNVVSSSYALTASYVQNAVTASYVLNAVSSSYALSSSYAVTSSYALSASYAPSSPAFPFTGSALITGSLGVTGSVSILNPATNTSVMAVRAGGGSGNVLSVQTTAGAQIVGIGFTGGTGIIENGNSLPLRLSATNADLIMWNNGTGNLTFTTNGSEKGKIFNNGNFYLGTTPTDFGYKLDVSGSARIRGVTNTSISSSLVVYGSGSAQPVFTVQGSQGELFSVTDNLSGSLFSVNDISGLPIMEVFSDNTTLMGSYQAPSLNTTVKTTTIAGNNVIYSIPTSSYNGAWFEYVATSASNARSGQIMSVCSSNTIKYTETTTTDIGTTTGLNFMVMITGSNFALTGSATTAGWTIKTIVRSI